MNHSYIRQHIKGLVIRTNKVNPDKFRITRPHCNYQITKINFMFPLQVLRSSHVRHDYRDETTDCYSN